MQYEFFSCMAFSRSGLFFLQRAYTYDIVNINPDQQAVIEPDNDDIVTRDVPAYLFTSWAKGNYEFRNTSLSEIVAQLSRWYNVDIYFKNESLKDKRFAGIIFRDEELNFAIEVIERVSNVHFTREGETIYIEDSREK